MFDLAEQEAHMFPFITFSKEKKCPVFDVKVAENGAASKSFNTPTPKHPFIWLRYESMCISNTQRWSCDIFSNQSNRVHRTPTTMRMRFMQNSMVGECNWLAQTRIINQIIHKKSQENHQIPLQTHSSVHMTRMDVLHCRKANLMTSRNCDIRSPYVCLIQFQTFLSICAHFRSTNASHLSIQHRIAKIYSLVFEHQHRWEPFCQSVGVKLRENLEFGM